MGQISMKIIRLPGSVLGENQQGSITKSAVASMAHGEIISEQRSPGGQGMQPGRFASLGTVNNASSSCSRAGGLRSQG